METFQDLDDIFGGAVDASDDSDLDDVFAPPAPREKPWPTDVTDDELAFGIRMAETNDDASKVGEPIDLGDGTTERATGAMQTRPSTRAKPWKSEPQRAGESDDDFGFRHMQDLRKGRGGDPAETAMDWIAGRGRENVGPVSLAHNNRVRDAIRTRRETATRVPPTLPGAAVAATIDPDADTAAPTKQGLGEALLLGVGKGATTTAATALEYPALQQLSVQRKRREGVAAVGSATELSDDKYKEFRADFLFNRKGAIQPLKYQTRLQLVRLADKVRSGEAGHAQIAQFAEGFSKANPPRAAADWLMGIAKKYFPVSKEMEEHLAVKVATGGGSSIPFIFSTLLGGPGATAIFAASTGAGEAIQIARANGVTDEKVLQNVAAMGLVPGLVDALPIANLFRIAKRIGRGPGVKNRILSWARDILVQGGVEGGTEAVQSLMQDFIAKVEHMPERELGAHMAEEGFVGFLVGMLFGTGGVAVSEIANRGQPADPAAPPPDTAEQPARDAFVPPDPPAPVEAPTAPVTPPTAPSDIGAPVAEPIKRARPTNDPTAPQAYYAQQAREDAAQPGWTEADHRSRETQLLFETGPHAAKEYRAEVDRLARNRAELDIPTVPADAATPVLGEEHIPTTPPEQAGPPVAPEAVDQQPALSDPVSEARTSFDADKSRASMLTREAELTFQASPEFAARYRTEWERLNEERSGIAIPGREDVKTTADETSLFPRRRPQSPLELTDEVIKEPDLTPGNLTAQIEALTAQRAPLSEQLNELRDRGASDAEMQVVKDQINTIDDRLRPLNRESGRLQKKLIEDRAAQGLDAQGRRVEEEVLELTDEVVEPKSVRTPTRIEDEDRDPDPLENVRKRIERAALASGRPEAEAKAVSELYAGRARALKNYGVENPEEHIFGEGGWGLTFEGDIAASETREQDDAQAATGEQENKDTIDALWHNHQRGNESVGAGTLYQGPRSSTGAFADFIRQNPDGFTIDPVSMKEPTTGHSVALLKSAENIIDEGKLSNAAVDEVLDDYRALAEITGKDLKIGGWLNRADGKYYLDVVEIVRDRTQALYRAAAAEQIAIFDFGEGNEITTKEGITALREAGSYDVQAFSKQRRTKEELGRLFGEARRQDRGRPETLNQGTSKPRASITFGKDATLIKLFEGADASSLLHEGAHLFLRDVEMLANQGVARATVDMRVIRKFVGNTGGKLTVAQEEQFARGFEAYLREGKAPSARLREAFERFREWLVEIYQTVGALNVEISPEMRTVFDRMIATDEEIQRRDVDASIDPATAVLDPGDNFVGVRAPTLPPAEPLTKKQIVVRREDILKPLMAALNVPLYRGRVPKTMSGFARRHTNEVRVRNDSDLEVVIHEVAHVLDNRDSAISEAWDQRGDDGRRRHDELLGVSYDRGNVKEGWAEFIRLWATQPEEARAHAPAMHTWWEDHLEKNEKLGKAMRSFKEGALSWFEQDPLARATSKVGITESINSGITASKFHKFEGGVVDDLLGFKLTHEYLYGKDSRPIAYDLARLTRAAPAIVSGAHQWGAPKIINGSMRFVDADGNANVLETATKKGFDQRRNKAYQPWGLDHIMRKVKRTGIEEWGMYMVGVRAAHLKKQGRENHFDDTEIAAMLALKTDIREEARLDWVKFNKQLLDFAQERGQLFTAEDRANWETDVYLPFYRVAAGKKKARGGTNRAEGVPGFQKVIYKLKGGTENIGNPIDNIAKNVELLIESAIVAHARRENVDHIVAAPESGRFLVKIAPESKEVLLLTDSAKAGWKASYKAWLIETERATAKETGRSSAGTSEVINEKLADIDAQADELFDKGPAWFKMWLHGNAPKGSKVIAIMRNGKPEYYEMPETEDRLLFDAFEALPRTVGLHMLATPGNFIRKVKQSSITKTLGFAVRNFGRDQLHAAIFSEYGHKPLLTALNGLRHRILNTAYYKDFMASGGAFSTHYEHEASFVQKRSWYTSRGIPYNRVIDTPRKALVIFDSIFTSLEEATRIGESVRAGRKRGANQIERGMAAREVSVDFAMNGSNAAARNLMAQFNFLHAASVGIHKAYRGYGPESHRNHAVRNMVVLAAFSTALWALNQGNPLYDDEPDWLRDTHWLFYVPRPAYFLWIANNPGKFFPDTVEETAALFHGRILLPKPHEAGIIAGSMVERSLDYLTSGFDDTDEYLAHMGKNMRDLFRAPLAPSFAEPFLEHFANRSWFFDRPIVPQHLEGKEPADQWTPYSSRTLRWLGELLGDNPTWAQISPLVTEHYIRGFFGSIGAYALTMMDRSFFDDMPALPHRAIPGVSAFYRPMEDVSTNRYSKLFYERVRKISEFKRSTKDRMDLAETREEAEAIYKARIEEDEAYYASEFLTNYTKGLSSLSKQSRKISVAKTRGLFEKLVDQLRNARSGGKYMFRNDIDDLKLSPVWDNTGIAKKRMITLLIRKKNTLFRQAVSISDKRLKSAEAGTPLQDLPKE